jgi:hypothetical protein
VTGRLACAAAVWLALALVGCGGGSSERAAAPKVTATGTAPPEPTPPALTYASGAREALQGGAIAVADFTYRVAVAPSRMDVNKEQQLSQLRWTGWGSARTSGRGDLRTLICEPTCAQGVFEDSHGVVVLSAPKRCGDRRFYTRSSMTYDDPDTGKTRAPATYLRTPPC